MAGWQRTLRSDPLPWLLEPENSAVRHQALRLLLVRPDDDPDVRQAHDQAMASEPIATILAHQHPDGYWVKPGFPSGYVADSLQILEVMAELGTASDPRLARTVEWVRSLQDQHGRWRNRYAYSGKMWCDIDKQGAPSKWVTLRACYALKHAMK